MCTVAFWLRGIDGVEPEAERLPLAHVEFVSQHQIGLIEYSYPLPGRRDRPPGSARWLGAWLAVFAVTL
jgi:hypothetical protein